MLTEEHLKNLQEGDKLNSPEGVFFEIVRVLYEAFQIKSIDEEETEQPSMQLLSWATIQESKWSIPE